MLLQIFVPFNPDGIAKPWRGIITADHTFARYEKEPWVLFDDKKDPHQMKNLAADPAAAPLREKLDNQLAALMKKNGDAWSIGSHETVEEGGKLYKHATFYTVQEYLDWAKANPDKAP